MNLSMSLVTDEKLRRDPRKLAYLYPRMPVIRFKELVEDYHRSVTIRTVEQVAEMFGAILVPASCVHHKRRRPDRRVMIYGRTYYVFERDEMTDLEWAKYRELCGEVDDDAGAGSNTG